MATNRYALFLSVVVVAFAIEAAGTDDWKYWTSSKAVEYAEAAKECEENGDALLQIETAEKLKQVEKFLQSSSQTVSLLWVGGKYDTSSKSFIWENGKPILGSMWAPGQPSDSNANSRVAAITVGHVVQLKSQSNSHHTRFICEGK